MGIIVKDEVQKVKARKTTVPAKTVLVEEIENSDEPIVDPECSKRAKSSSHSETVIIPVVPPPIKSFKDFDISALVKSPSGLQELATKCDCNKFSFEEIPEKLLKAKDIVLHTDLEGKSRTVQDLSKLCAPADKELFEEIDKKISELALLYNKKIGDLIIILAELNGDLSELEKFAKGEVVDRWNGLEDSVLHEGPSSSSYAVLLKMKGKEAIERRKRFLELKN